jgi:hypothetical protein
MARQQQRDCAGAEPYQRPVGTAGQNDRHTRIENDSGHLRLRQIFELLGHHVSCFKIGHDENVGLAGNWRDDALSLGGFGGDRIVEGERAIEDAAGDLAAIGHLAQRRCVDRRRNLRCNSFNRGEDRDFGDRDAERVSEVDGILYNIDLVFERRVNVDSGVGNDHEPRIIR